jgi:dienelactone hydrolase
LLVAFVPAAAKAADDAAPTTRPIKGLRIDGDKFKFDDGDLVFNGILLKPEGKGPFPAVLISHGRGGSSENFGRPKAQMMAKWGFVCIAPDYTFSDKNADPRSLGASPENLRRAAKCLDILASLPEVDAKRLCAYGNSMGAYVTIGLAAQYPHRLASAAITAGGIIDTPGRAAPSKEQAQKIRTPFCILHGANDTQEAPGRSKDLEDILTANKVDCERFVFDDAGHEVHMTKAQEVNAKIEAWFKKYAKPQ